MTALSTPRIINTNYLHLEREAWQLPVHLTSFPPVAVTVLFILCFFLYIFCSHVDSYKHLRCFSRIEPIHHEHFKRPALQSSLNSPHSYVGSHVFGEQFNPHLLILGLISIPETVSSLPRMHSCFSVLCLLESLSLCI